MWIAEQLLFGLCRALYRTQVAHSSDMKDALHDIDAYDSYRAGEIGRILEMVERLDVPIAGRTVLDLGCNDGAISEEYLRRGAGRVIGVDIDARAIERAGARHSDERLSFVVSTVGGIPLEDRSVETIISYDVFEHIARPDAMLGEMRRILAPGGRVLIGTWGWRHPFAPHLWSVMPVPWAHVVFSERTVLRVCRRVYHSSWYVPNMHDFDDRGERFADKFANERISSDYLNKYLIRDFERAFLNSGFDCEVHAVPFGSAYARWTRPLLAVPWLCEFLAGYVWFVLKKAETPSENLARVS